MSYLDNSARYRPISYTAIYGIKCHVPCINAYTIGVFHNYLALQVYVNSSGMVQGTKTSSASF